MQQKSQAANIKPTNYKKKVESMDKRINIKLFQTLFQTPLKVVLQEKLYFKIFINSIKTASQISLNTTISQNFRF